MRKKIRGQDPHVERCACDVCRDKHPFDLPENLYDSFKRCDVVLFAGAGVSTETRLVFPYTLYDDIRGNLRMLPNDRPKFPELMSLYCSKPNGRPNLLRKIRERFEYIRSFPELYREATRFHRELSTLFVVENVITTNWDTYFELECGAIPFATAEDFTFWELPGRKVLKLHGSVDSYGSIIATKEDYDACRDHLAKGLLGSMLRMFLATKTIVYVGFSFSDEDFIDLHDSLSKEMSGLRPQSYIVTLDRSSNDRFIEKGLLPIYSDATYFISKVKQRLVTDDLMLADDRFDRAENLLLEIRRVHREVSDIDAARYPDVIYGLSYQDGLIHSLERILALKSTGYYSHSCNSRSKAKLYLDEIRPKKLKAGIYHDVAYVDGYADGLVCLLSEDNICPPLYYTFGVKGEIRSIVEYKRAMGKAVRTSPKEHRFAQEIVDRNGWGDGIVPHHTPFLL